MSLGALPPALAQPSKNHRSQVLGLMFHFLQGGDTENSVIANVPLHSAFEP